MSEDFEKWKSGLSDDEFDFTDELVFAAWQTATKLADAKWQALLKDKDVIATKAAKLLRDIDAYGGLKEGGEQYPNGLNCHDIADRLIAQTSGTDALDKMLETERVKVLEDWDDLLEDLELHGMHDFEPYIKSKAKMCEYALKENPEPTTQKNA